MLLPKNILPENSIYYNGAFVLQVLQEGKTLTMLDLYQNVKLKKNMSFPVFLLCLDWLYLINVIDLKGNGDVTLCI